MKRHVGGVAEYRAAKVKPLSCRCEARLKIPRVIFGRPAFSLYIRWGFTPERADKRTTFIRVQEQENRIFNNLYLPMLAWSNTPALSHPTHRIAKWKIGKYIATTSVPIIPPV